MIWVGCVSTFHGPAIGCRSFKGARCGAVEGLDQQAASRGPRPKKKDAADAAASPEPFASLQNQLTGPDRRGSDAGRLPTPDLASAVRQPCPKAIPGNVP